eukprot:scaffold117_cov257-Prasinococcus_capsulatus_cf.AAC.2
MDATRAKCVRQGIQRRVARCVSTRCYASQQRGRGGEEGAALKAALSGKQRGDGALLGSTGGAQVRRGLVRVRCVTQHSAGVQQGARQAGA